MKLNFTIDVDDAEYLQDEIIASASEKFIEQVLGDGYDEKDLYSMLERKVLDKLTGIMNTDFKNEVTQKVTENLANKFERTKQYKALINNEGVISDNLIKTGLKDLVADIVKSEMKKMFK